MARPVAKLLYTALVLGGWRDGWRGLLKLCLESSGGYCIFYWHSDRVHVWRPGLRIGCRSPSQIE